MSQKRRNHLPKVKASVAIKAIKGVETLGEINRLYQISVNLVMRWRKQLLER